MLLIILSYNQKTYLMRLCLFIRFLKVYGLYEEYLGELRRFRGVCYSDQYLLNRLTLFKPSCYLVSSITWCETSRGSYFWSMVNDAWLNYLNDHTFEN